ncbi:MAG TPA: cytochrome C peroxidase, partial [Chromatiales bacterium]|nr:cytochrome C peroxidase [Chromatiales bacterium]
MHRHLRHALLALVAGGLVAAASAPAAAAHTGGPALPEQAPAPADNPTTPAKVELGKMLYFDPRLSSTGTVSCNSC